MSIDLSRLSAKELSSLIRDAQKRKTVVSKRQPITKVRAQLVKAAQKAGYTINELFGTGAPAAAAAAAKAPRAARGSKVAKSKGSKIAPKYRDPANPANTWTGRGKQPRWLAGYTNGGRKVEDFLIQQ